MTALVRVTVSARTSNGFRPIAHVLVADDVTKHYRAHWWQLWRKPRFIVTVDPCRPEALA